MGETDMLVTELARWLEFKFLNDVSQIQIVNLTILSSLVKFKELEETEMMMA